MSLKLFLAFCISEDFILRLVIFLVCFILNKFLVNSEVLKFFLTFCCCFANSFLKTVPSLPIFLSNASFIVLKFLGLLSISFLRFLPVFIAACVIPLSMNFLPMSECKKAAPPRVTPATTAPILAIRLVPEESRLLSLRTFLFPLRLAIYTPRLVFSSSYSLVSSRFL